MGVTGFDRVVNEYWTAGEMTDLIGINLVNANDAVYNVELALAA